MKKKKRNTLRKQKQNKKERKNETNTKKTSLFFTLDIIGIRMGLHLNQQSPTIDVLSKQ